MMVEKLPFSSWQALSALALGAFAFELGCAVEKESDEGNGDTVLEEEEVRDVLTGMLEDAWLTAIEPTLALAETSVAALQESAGAWVDSSDSETARTDAQNAWIEAMRDWQTLEVMQVGPAGSSLTAVGGDDIRDSIYSWPTTNACRIDQVTCRLEFDEADYFDEALINSFGLDALETVLFSTPNENSCSTNSGINRNGEWDALGADGVAQARADFAVVLANRVADDLQRIRDGWEGGFAEQLATAGQGSTDFPDSVNGVNAIYNGLFYMETYGKDRKLGWPLGLRACGADDCTDEVESLAAGLSHEWLAANLEGFRTLYTGGEGLGMYDLLVSVDEAELADNVLTQLDEADSAVATLSEGLNDTMRNDPEKLAAVHAAVKDVTDLVKTDIATVLSLTVPAEAAGDND